MSGSRPGRSSPGRNAPGASRSGQISGPRPVQRQDQGLPAPLGPWTGGPVVRQNRSGAVICRRSALAMTRPGTLGGSLKWPPSAAAAMLTERAAPDSAASRDGRWLPFVVWLPATGRRAVGNRACCPGWRVTVCPCGRAALTRDGLSLSGVARTSVPILVPSPFHVFRTRRLRLLMLAFCAAPDPHRSPAGEVPEGEPSIRARAPVLIGTARRRDLLPRMRSSTPPPRSPPRSLPRLRPMPDPRSPPMVGATRSPRHRAL